MTIGFATGVGLLVLACASSPTSDRSSTAPAPAVLVNSDEFARRIEEPGVVTINVHIPNEGDIAGTDLDIAFDQILTTTKLPVDTATPLAVYCRSGNMSATAVKDLQAKGYTNIVELKGGYNAWTAAGRTLQPTGS